MKPTRLLLAAGALVFIFTLVATVPARMLDALAGDAVTLTAPSGTLWRGSSQQLIAGPLRLGATQWRISGLSLLLGRLAADIDTEVPGGFARGDVAVSLGGTMRISDFEAAAPLEAFGGMLGFDQARGDAAVNIQLAQLEDGWPTKLVGSLRMGNVPLDVAGSNTGSAINLAADFDVPDAGSDGRVPGRISDQGGPLEIAGTITLYPPANYDIDALISARRDAPPEISQGLIMLGPEGPNGSRQFTMSGSF